MGGFTAIYLRNTSEENIKKQNKKLKEFGVAKQYRFYSEDDIRFEFEAFKKGDGHFPERQFPKSIMVYSEFKQYWNPKALGEVFCPHNGSLTFDCYFGRTSKRAMRNIGKYLAENYSEIIGASGSFETFMERGMTKAEQKIIKDSLIQVPMYYL